MRIRDRIGFFTHRALIVSLLVCFCSCDTSLKKEVVHESELLKIERLTEHSFVHISYLETEEYGKVASNGLVVVDANEALIYDTPVSNRSSQELIDWLKNEMNVTAIVVVVSHFHADALGGLETFHDNGIASFANTRTQEFAEIHKLIVPAYGISNSYEHSIGSMKVISMFMGEGHTQDNMVAYVKEDHILFGGCLVKRLGAGKGNIADANISEWPKTVEKLRQMLPNVTYVIPGHGEVGDQELLVYTEELFR